MKAYTEHKSRQTEKPFFILQKSRGGIRRWPLVFFSTRICRSHEPPTRTEERRRSPSSRLQNRWEATRFCSTISGFALNIYNQKAYYWSCTATIPTGFPAVAPAMFIRNNRSEHQNLGSNLWRKGWKISFNVHCLSGLKTYWEKNNNQLLFPTCLFCYHIGVIRHLCQKLSQKSRFIGYEDRLNCLFRADLPPFYQSCTCTQHLPWTRHRKTLWTLDSARYCPLS